MCLYAHLGLESVDALARELLNGPLKFDTDLSKVHVPQVQSHITPQFFAPNWRIFYVCCYILLCVTT